MKLLPKALIHLRPTPTGDEVLFMVTSTYRLQSGPHFENLFLIDTLALSLN